MNTIARPQRWCLERNGHRAWAGSNADLLWYADDTAARGAGRVAPVWVVSVALEGHIEVWVEGVGGLRGAGVVLPPGRRHRVGGGGPSLTLWVEPGAVSLPREPVVLALDRAAELVDLCSVVPDQESWWDSDAEGRREAMLQALGARTVAPDPRLSDVLGRIGDDAQLARLAGEAGVSPRRLRRLAQDQLGVRLATFRRWRRLHAATIQLPFRPAVEIAADTGFSDQPHLHRTIMTMIGTPASRSPASAHRSSASTSR